MRNKWWIGLDDTLVKNKSLCKTVKREKKIKPHYFCCYTFDSQGCSHSEWQLSSYLSLVMSLCDTVLPRAVTRVSTGQPDELRETTFSQLILAFCSRCSVTHSCLFTHLFLPLMNTLNFTLHVYVGEIIVWCQTCSRVLGCVFCVLGRSVVHTAYSQCLGTVSYPRTWESWKWSDKCIWCTATSGELERALSFSVTLEWRLWGKRIG